MADMLALSDSQLRALWEAGAGLPITNREARHIPRARRRTVQFRQLQPPIHRRFTKLSRSQDGDVVPANLNTDESTANDEAQPDGNLIEQRRIQTIRVRGILDSRDNAVAAAYKFLTEDILFEIFHPQKAHVE